MKVSSLMKVLSHRNPDDIVYIIDDSSVRGISKLRVTKGYLGVGVKILVKKLK